MTALSPSTAPPLTFVKPAELPKSYTPGDWEQKVFARWEQAKAFHADPRKAQGEGAPSFCIVIPPPNVTAALHLGHAFNNTLQDVLVRYHRMRQGPASTLWMPGTDHAGIATQAVVEKRLLLQGKRRTDFTREQFIGKVQEWKDEYEATILAQLKAMGCSCDYERTRFTMDEVCAKAVREAFFRLFKDGLIYRGKRLVNWDPASQTALADDEVEMEEVHGHMYYLRYPLANAETPKRGHAETEFVTVATTRPETMLGDVAVAMNPKDPRATQFVGKKVRLPIVDRVVPIIADDYVVRPVEFGGDENDAKAKIATGFLKVTPAHDDNDYAIGQRHNLPIINVFAPDASISDKFGWTDVSDEAKQFLGLPREDARTKVVEWFKARGLLEAMKQYTHSVGHSYRSHVPIEPYLSDQWYVAVTDDRLRGEALRAMAQREDAFPPPSEGGGKGVGGAHDSPSTPAHRTPHPPPDPLPQGRGESGDGALTFYPARYAKTFQAWHENLRDWCISRQLWWGHRIPVWSKRVVLTEENWPDHLAGESGLDDVLTGNSPNECAFIRRVADGEMVDWRRDLNPVVRDTAGEYDIVICGKDDREMKRFEGQGFTQDPDVLDTWFSSALWPISTMGWPDPDAFPSKIPEGATLLNTFNPSTVLCTAREIITLWVSRMVMFNRYLRDGLLPFRDVYIHAMIQDGHGQKMSKSLGNGVDPRDIIHSHGADALRFIMASIATQTQDVRLPVDMVCPHCDETLHSKEITTSAGYRVADAQQTCPKCHKKMVSGYGSATGLATATNEMPLARNTSSKFDEGRNLVTKLWQVTAGFALPNLAKGESKAQGLPSLAFDELSLVDRWILARLYRTLRGIEGAIAEYRFKEYADAIYDFVRRDFCDWYVEAIKPTIKSDPRQQQVLRTLLNAIMRLLHPVMPFVTETLWPHVNACGVAGLSGVKLEPCALLAIAGWPEVDASLDDAAAIADFERVKSLVNAIRNLRSERQVPPKKKIHLAAPVEVMNLIRQSTGVVESLALLESVDALAAGEARPQGAIPFGFEGREILLSGLVDALDVAAEKARLTKVIAEKERAVAGFRGKLSNEGYVSKAPPEKVEETRKMLAQAEADLEAARKAIQSLA
jgi:valyl-tRNA synthetase